MLAAAVLLDPPPARGAATVVLVPLAAAGSMVLALHVLHVAFLNSALDVFAPATPEPIAEPDVECHVSVRERGPNCAGVTLGAWRSAAGQPKEASTATRTPSATSTVPVTRSSTARTRRRTSTRPSDPTSNE